MRSLPAAQWISTGPLGAGQDLEIAAVEIDDPRVERRIAVVLEHVAVERGVGEVGGGDVGDPRILFRIADVVADHLAGKGGVPARGVALALVAAAKVDDHRQAQAT